MYTLPPINSPLLGSSEGFSRDLHTGTGTGTGKRAALTKNRIALLLGACFGSLLVWTLTAPEAVTKLQHGVTSSLSKQLSTSKKATALKATSSSSSACNPFTAPGQLQVKQGEPDANVWQPWDPTCKASALLTDLRNRERLPWLHNKTVAIIGDSIDRDHIEYFCEMSRGNMEWIWEVTRYDPPYTYSRSDPLNYTSSENGQSSGGGDQSRPRICYLDEYDFAVVFAFHYGLSDGGDGERNLPHYYPPFKFEDRLSNILVPILKASKRYPPDLVELGTGTWDLQHWTFEDRELEVDRMTSLSDERAQWYTARFNSALQHVEDAFGSEEEAEGKPTKTKFMFREMQHTKMVDTVPPPRVHGLKDLQSHIMKQRIESGTWIVDPLATLLLGQEHFYRDSIHPVQLPAGKIWADIMLYTLQEAS